MQRKFPYQRTVSQVFDVALSHPVVGLLPDANRVSVKLDAHLASPFMPQPVDGVFTLSSELAYDAASETMPSALAPASAASRKQRLAGATTRVICFSCVDPS